MEKAAKQTLTLGAAAALAAALTLAPALAKDKDEAKDHEQARKALEQGEVLSLTKILSMIQPEIDGEIVETEFEREDGAWIYEIKYISRQGRMTELELDAKTGEILKTEEKKPKKHKDKKKKD